MSALWTWDDLVHAAGARADGAPSVSLTGFSIDTRTLAPGDVFVALKDARDGHDFVSDAFAKGASAALVATGYARKPGDGALVRVDDPLAALARIGAAARARARARVVAVTGSAGKTGTKEMLRAALSAAGTVHASQRSYNNHWGVPLTLALLPPDADFAVFEIGMNHPGEITPLSRLVRPEIAVITNVLPVHLGHFANEEAIADAKAEIFAGLRPGGTAILNRDNRHFAQLAAAARAAGAHICSFGTSDGADVRAASMAPDGGGTTVTLDRPGRPVFRVGAPGLHLAANALAVAAVVDCLGLDLAATLAPLAGVTAPPGRGARSVIACAGGAFLLVDESYNANPASMRAALAGLATTPRADFPRRIAVLGDMLELGPASADLHRGLADAVASAGIDLLFACGPMMRGLFDTLPSGIRGAWRETSRDLAPEVAAAVRPGDAVMVKGSLGTNMAPVVAALKALGGSGAAAG